MKTKPNVLRILAALLLLLPALLHAQSIVSLYDFTSFSGDGYGPEARVLLSGQTLYGTASGGGTNDGGTVFAVNTNGAGFTVLHTFSTEYSDNSDGDLPAAGLLLSGSTLYGTASDGGTNGGGTVFAVNTNGTQFTVLHSFDLFNDGNAPLGDLVLAGHTLYGTTSFGGSGNYGTVFAVNTDGSDYAILYNFTNDMPGAGLVLSGNTLYGTTESGGTNLFLGDVFAINTNGSGYAVLHSFNNTDGSLPICDLILTNGRLYGTTAAGGPTNAGTVFAINTNGTGFATLHNFTINDGDMPVAGLVMSGNTLYGTTHGGPQTGGTVFAVNTDGTGFTDLHIFGGDDDTGTFPLASLVLSGNTLYGTTYEGGAYGSGNIFALTLPPPAPVINQITLTGTNLILHANNGQSGGTYVTLMSSNLTLPFGQWTPVATNLLTANGAFTITATNAVNTRAGQRFYVLQMQ